MFKECHGLTFDKCIEEGNGNQDGPQVLVGLVILKVNRE